MWTLASLVARRLLWANLLGADGDPSRPSAYAEQERPGATPSASGFPHCHRRDGEGDSKNDAKPKEHRYDD